MNEGEDSARAWAAARVLEMAAAIPLDQAGPVMIPPMTYWRRLAQRIACRFKRHAWSKAWVHRPLVPAEFDVARMLADGAPWPTYSVKVCIGCLEHRRRRIA